MIRIIEQQTKTGSPALTSKRKKLSAKFNVTKAKSKGYFNG
jgi:hypothetical protein